MKKTTGLVLGKFLPPHAGHLYLLRFAANYVSDLTIVVDNCAWAPIQGTKRVEWLTELFPRAKVCLLTDENPQLPHEHPRFWEIWRDSLKKFFPQGGPDFVFTGEEYGKKLSEVLGATFVPVSGLRELLPISGTAIRDNPLRYWEYLPSNVRAHYLKRVCLFGPESTGKSTLAAALAAKYATYWVPEFARTLLELKGGECLESDLPVIARGQVAAEDALAHIANKVLLCDTDALLTEVWSEILFGSVHPEVAALASSRTYDLYLLTDIDIPWEKDPVRYLPEKRAAFFERCESILKERNRPYLRLSGSPEERLAQASKAIDELLRSQ